MKTIVFWDKKYLELLTLLYEIEPRSYALYGLFTAFKPILGAELGSSSISMPDMKKESYDALDEAKSFELWETIKSDIIEPSFDAPDCHPLNELVTRFGITDLQRKLVVFLFLYDRYVPFTEYFCGRSEYQAIKLLERYCGIKASEFIKEFRETGVLCKKGITSTECHPKMKITRYNISISLAQYVSWFLDSEQDKPLSSFLMEIPEKGFLPLESFDISAEAILSAQTILTNPGKGIVFLYGAPGTGKTELSKSLSASINRRPCFLTRESSTGNRPIDRLLTAATLLDKQQDILIVDEADDLLNTDFSLSSGGGVKKSFVNDFLDSFDGKLILISNRIWGIPDSILRRMQVAIQFKNLTYRQRTEIWNRINLETPVFSTEDRMRFALEYKANPSTIQQVYSVCGTLSAQNVSKEVLLHTAADMLGRSDELLRRIPYMPKIKRSKINMELLTLSVSAEELLSAVSQWKNETGDHEEGINFLFYGIPGTGKTEFAHHIAELTGIPAITKRASDLLSPWVGETEEKIREAFREAQDCVLVIDEADSFISNRSAARNSWERTQVNEFLTQMESFKGVFFATTNFNSLIDDASLRRFQYKVEFLPTPAEKRAALFSHFFPDLALDGVPLHRLLALPLVTPGNFGTISRQIKYAKQLTCERIIELLEQENSCKGNKTVGF